MRLTKTYFNPLRVHSNIKTVQVRFQLAILIVPYTIKKVKMTFIGLKLNTNHKHIVCDNFDSRSTTVHEIQTGDRWIDSDAKEQGSDFAN